MNQNNINTLLHFLNMPLNTTDELFKEFSALPDAICGFGKNAKARYIYIPGTKKDRVVLVAHIDTVWDKSYKSANDEKQSVIFENGIFKGTNPNLGIGADDRAGCAMLWSLRNSGHSLLLLDGEEQGKIGANYLKKTNKKLFKELNRHQFMIEFDWIATNGCLYNQVDNTDKFKKYIEATLNFTDSKAKGGTDLAILCRNICGVNLGVGYRNHHTQNETLVLSEWENTFNKVSEFLNKPQPKFKSKFFAPHIRFLKIKVYGLLKILKIKK